MFSSGGIDVVVSVKSVKDTDGHDLGSYWYLGGLMGHHSSFDGAESCRLNIEANR